MVQKNFKRNEVIFKERESQLWMYNICEGTVEIYAGYGTAEETKLVTLTEGQIFGEIGMIGIMPRTATAVAAADQVVLELICYDEFEEYLKNHPENLQPIMSNVSRRIRELTDDLAVIIQITNEALGKRESLNSKDTWLSDCVRKILGKLKSKACVAEEFVIRPGINQVSKAAEFPLSRYRAGDVIFNAGGESDCMYEIFSGSVGIYAGYQTGNEKLLTKLQHGSVFGEMGILDDMPRSATAVCLEDCCVLIIRKEHFMLFFRKRPKDILRILRQMCSRLRDLTDTYLQVCKMLEEMVSAEQKETEAEENLAWAKLEHFRESQLYSSMYDVSASTEWIHDYL